MAREIFDAAYEARMLVRETNRKAQQMRERLGPSGMSYEPHGKHSYHDPMNKVDELIDWETENFRQTLDGANAALSEALDVIRGVIALGGEDLGKVLLYRYYEGMEWEKVSSAVDQPVEVVKLMAEEGFKWIDSVGIAKIKESYERA